MNQTTRNVLDTARHMAGHYSRPNKFIVWYCDKRGLKGDWLRAPWCAMFQSFIANAAGIGPQVGEFASCPSWVTWFKKHDRWSKTPREGALVFYDWDHDGQADHVGLVSKVGKTTIKAIEGNTRVGASLNWVHEQTRAKSTVLGYGYPTHLTGPQRAPEGLYTVRKGDSLSSIAKAHKTTWQKIWSANKAAIVKPSLIKPGQKLVIPK